MTSGMQNRKIDFGSVICDNFPFLCALARTKSIKRRRRLLKAASSVQLLALAEICLNIVKARFQLTTRQKKRMMPYAEFIRRMSRARSEGGARKTLHKGSGFSPHLFPALLTPIIIELSRLLYTNNKQSTDKQ